MRALRLFGYIAALAAACILTAYAAVQPPTAYAVQFKVPPTPDHYVTDGAGALSSGTRTSLENELRAYEQATGHQVIVWIGDTTGDVPLETYTAESAHQWRIGRRGKDDGAVLFLFMKDHRIRIEVGYGLEGSLTDADSYRIIQNVITPRMRAGDVDGAVSSGVAAMLTTISPSYKNVTPPPSAPMTSAPGAQVWVILVFVLIFILAPIIFQIIMMRRFGHMVTGRGSGSGAFWGGMLAGSSFGGGGGDFGGGGFSAGGGDFGGGGASGGW